MATTKTITTITVSTTDPTLHEHARQLAKTLNLPFEKDVDRESVIPRIEREKNSFLLVVTTQRLELRQLGKTAPGPIYTDFVSGSNAHRRQYGGGRGQPLARAIGLKGGHYPLVLDATAGLGRDAFVLAYLGCNVLLAERNRVVAALLEDGLQRALNDPEVAPIVSQRMRFFGHDARLLMRSAEPRPEVIYLDPMYPPRSKSAQVKKEMRSLQQIVGHSDDDDLLKAALTCATRRVVVKRPSGADPLGECKPTFAISSKKTRYDVYVTQEISTEEPIKNCERETGSAATQDGDTALPRVGGVEGEEQRRYIARTRAFKRLL
ncbi:MAG: class I SAM-dependent methyltransferase [Gammaproteobacteria bacterium]|nr:class I SAM-dependent methyltransferase [Gammaproteobacteria bacterium]